MGKESWSTFIKVKRKGESVNKHGSGATVPNLELSVRRVPKEKKGGG
jgi:hypothetical protein